MSDSKRYYSAIIMIAAVILLLEKGGVTAFYITAFALAVFSLNELRNLFIKNNVVIPRIPLIFFGIGAVYYFSLILDSKMLPVLFFTAFTVFLSFKLKSLSSKNGFFERIFFFIFSVLFISVPLACLINIRQSDNGLVYIYLILVATWASDTGAYLVGKKWGKRKMSPSISPNKTLEGLAGGIFLTIGVFVLWHLYDSISILSAVLLGIVVSLSATAGDLLESFLKRNAGVKDSGSLIPGHGGILDRIDALLFTAPVWYIFMKFFL